MGCAGTKGWLKWSLGLVCLTFVLFYVPSFLRNGGIAGVTGAQSDDTIATVNGHDITAGDYRRLYAQQLQSIRQSYGGNIDEKMLQQLGIAQRLLSQMVDEEAMVAEADRLGLRVSDAELAERIKRMAGFQQNGQFIGEVAYREILQMQRPPVRPTEFEDQLRRSLMGEKLQAAVTSWVRVADAEVDAEYRKRNEKVKLELAVFTANQFRAGIQPTDAELAAQFGAHQDSYKVPEKRRVRFLAIGADALRAKMTATPQEVEARYKDNLQTLLDARAGARQPHPVQDRGQGRSHSQEGRRSGPRASEGRRGFRGPRQEVFRGRHEQGQGRRPRLFRPRGHGQGVRGRGVRACSRAS